MAEKKIKETEEIKDFPEQSTFNTEDMTVKEEKEED